MRRIMMISFLLLGFLGTSSAQEWHGIKPLLSTCDDIKQALNVDKCEYPRSTYRLKDETVTISFEMCPCPLVCYYSGQAWKVPAGTVGGVTRQLHNPLPVTDFDVEGDKWTKTYTDFIGQIIYDNNEAGLRLSAIDGNVFNITHYPPLEKNKHLLCPKCSVPPPPNSEDEGRLSSWFNGYGNLSFEEERKRLDKFGIKLREQGPMSKGYIVVYGSCRSRLGEARERAEQAKDYVVNTHGISRHRIITIDGGQREEMLVELHIRARGLPPPRTFSSTYPNRADR